MPRNRNSPIVRITVMGVGGAGCNIVDVLAAAGPQQLTYVAANTDARALARTAIPTKLQLGCHDLSAGANPRYGKAAALASRRAIRNTLGGCDLLMLVAGLGGGTGSGGTPVIAKIAHKLGITCVAVVTLPFSFENRDRTAKEGLRSLQRHCAGTMVIDHTGMMARLGDDIDFAQFFATVDEIARSLVESVSSAVVAPSLVNLDFRSLKVWLEGAGLLSHSVINCTEQDPNQEIVEALVTDAPDAVRQLKQAHRILLTVTGPPSMRIATLKSIIATVRQHARPEASFHLATIARPEDDKVLRITLITSRSAQGPHLRGC